jgi:hypothetical protein
MSEPGGQVATHEFLPHYEVLDLYDSDDHAADFIHVAFSGVLYSNVLTGSFVQPISSPLRPRDTNNATLANSCERVRRPSRSSLLVHTSSGQTPTTRDVLGGGYD